VSEQRKGRRGWSAIAEWVVLAVVALLIAFVVQRFLFQAFYIPSRSMEPTLAVGDRVLVNKLSYRLHDVRRGDLVVFEAPESQQIDGIEDFVKRVVGLPGETVEWRDDGFVYIDGRRLDEPYLTPEMQGRTTIESPPPNCASETTEPYVSCTLPSGSVLVMGDNRTQSKDGRVFGPIPEDDIVGRVFLHIWPPTITWVYLGAVLAALILVFWGLRGLLRRRRSNAPPEGGGGGSPPSPPQPGPNAPTRGSGDTDVTVQGESKAPATATIRWTRSE